MKKYILPILSLMFSLSATAPAMAESLDVVYKTTDLGDLHMKINIPDDADPQKPLPTIIFYHGGGWVSGSLDVFANQADYLCGRGLVTICVQYRLATVGVSTPAECLMDAKSAIRYVRANASRYNVDPERIILSGASAGGHLAAATHLCPKINEASDDLSISTDAAALILYNPVICNGPEKSGSYQGWGYARVADYYQDISPMHNIVEGVPPTLFMVGDGDTLITPDVATEFARLIDEVGSRCDLHIYPGFKHSFFTLKADDARGFYLTMLEVDNFLTSLGYISGRNKVKSWLKSQETKYIL